jgi:integrase
VWFGGFSTKTQARDFYIARKAEQRDGRLFPERFQRGKANQVADLIDTFLAHYAGRSLKMYTLYGKWWKSRLGGKRLNEVTPQILEDAQADLLKKGLAPQTVLHYMKFLRRVLNIAVRDSRLHRNPFGQVKLPKVMRGRTRFLSNDEEAKLFKALGPVHSPWARLAILTGLRRSEQFTLRWTDVDLERGIITLQSTKAGGVQYVPLNEEAKAILRALESWHKSVWVFPSENAATPLDTHNFYTRVWIPAVKKAGIEWATWHDLRRTFASRLAMSGESESTIAALLRHSGTALVKCYAHLSPSHLRRAIERVSAFGKPLPPPSPSTVQEPKPEPNRDETEITAQIKMAVERGLDAEPIENSGI